MGQGCLGSAVRSVESRGSRLHVQRTIRAKEGASTSREAPDHDILCPTDGVSVAGEGGPLALRSRQAPALYGGGRAAESGSDRAVEERLRPDDPRWVRPHGDDLAGWKPARIAGPSGVDGKTVAR